MTIFGHVIRHKVVAPAPLIVYFVQSVLNCSMMLAVISLSAKESFCSALLLKLQNSLFLSVDFCLLFVVSPFGF